jgi:hypothetical protein
MLMCRCSRHVSQMLCLSYLAGLPSPLGRSMIREGLGTRCLYHGPYGPCMMHCMGQVRPMLGSRSQKRRMLHRCEGGLPQCEAQARVSCRQCSALGWPCI